jgi:uncharacterized protein YkwD
MARFLHARRLLGWVATSALLASSGCVIIDRGDDDDDSVSGAPTAAPSPTSAGPESSGAPAGAPGEVLTLVNQARTKARSCGSKSFPAAAPLRWNDRLARAAQAHSEDMAQKNYFDHQAPDGSDMAKRVGAQGYTFSALGENIAAGQRTPAEVVQGWLESPGHCANIMNGAFQEIGVGRAEGGSYKVYWTQNFGSPR